MLVFRRLIDIILAEASFFLRQVESTLTVAEQIGQAVHFTTQMVKLYADGLEILLAVQVVFVYQVREMEGSNKRFIYY